MDFCDKHLNREFYKNITFCENSISKFHVAWIFQKILIRASYCMFFFKNAKVPVNTRNL